MAPRVTRAAARAAATVEICVDEIDVVHVIDVADGVVAGAKDEAVEGGRKALEAVTVNMESAVDETLGGDEKSGGKRKKKQGTKKGKRKSRGVVVQELAQQDEEEVEVVADAPVYASENDVENASEGGKLSYTRQEGYQLILHSNFGASEECRISKT